MPKISKIVPIEGDKDHKFIRVKGKSNDLEEYINDKKLETKEESLQLSYDNYGLSK